MNGCRTCRTQGRESVAQAPERVRKAARSAVNIRGGSRMQESCTYGSVRGAPSNGRPYRDREISSGFEASAELRPIDPRRGGIIRAVVGLGKSIKLLRRLEEPPLTVE